jgi:hypothetical protein
MSDIEQRLAWIEARLRRAEDQLEILHLLNSYGPAVDSGSGTIAAAQWVCGGLYEFGDANGTQRAMAPDGLIALYEGSFHQELVRAGSAHLTATPKIVVDGDRAVAVGYSFVIVRRDDHWSVERSAINRWTLVREAQGWRVEERVNRALDGSPASHALMRAMPGEALDRGIDPG